jgi:rod shape-determining protein MreD
MRAARVALVVFVAIVLQASLVARFEAFGARGDIVLLVAICAGMAAGADDGAIVGFSAGMAFDLLLDTPLGLSALTYSVVGYLAGTFQGSVLRATWWIPVAGAVVASAMGVVVFALVGHVIGESTLVDPPLAAIVGVVAVLNGLLSLPVGRTMRWALADQDRARYSLR